MHTHMNFSIFAAKVHADLEYILVKNLREIIAKYASYVDSLRAAIEKKKISVDNFRSYLLSMPASSDEKLTLFSDVKSELKKRTTITDIFDFLKTEYASFLDYEIFDDICTHYKVKVTLKYGILLKQYAEKHKITELANRFPQLNKTGCKETIAMKFDIEKTCRLAQVKDLQKHVANALGVCPSALHIYNIQDGCVIITFVISASVAEAAFTFDKALQKAKFRAVSALWLKYKESIFLFGKEKSEIQGISL